jgi:hypothetical protein
MQRVQDERRERENDYSTNEKLAFPYGLCPFIYI